MAGTRTAPTVDGTPTFYTVRLRFIDAKGDLRSDSYRIEISTPALVETFAQSMQAASNASLYEIDVMSRYVGVDSVSNAADAVFVSKDDNIVLQMGESATGRKIDLFLPAPEEANFVTDTEQPDPTSTELSDITTAFAALKTVTYTPRQYRYTERRDKNPAVKL